MDKLNAAERNVWVGNLPPNATENDLQALFSSFGGISSAKVMASAKGTCGLVLFADPSSAQQASQALNGMKYLNQTLICRLANRDKGAPMPSPIAAPQLQQPILLGGVGHSGGLPRSLHTNVWIGNLPESISDSDLMYVLGSYGTVTSTKKLAPKNGHCAVLANFSTAIEAAKAISNLNGALIEGFTTPLIARLADDKRGSDSSGAMGLSAVAPAFPSIIPPAAAQLYLQSMALQQQQQALLAAAQISALSTGLGGGVGAGGNVARSTNLWIGNLPATVTEDQLSQVFAQVGMVTSMRVLEGKDPTRRAAMVNYRSVAEADEACRTFNGAVIEGYDSQLWH